MEIFEETRIKDIGKAQSEAEAVEHIVGNKIDKEWQKLKLAQAFGLEEKVTDSQAQIKKLLDEADRKLEDKNWEGLLNALFENPDQFYSNPAGFIEYVEAKFGKGKMINQGKEFGIPGTGYVLQFSHDKMNVRLVKLAV